MPSRAPMAPRARPTYDWNGDGGRSNQGAGMFILKPGINAQVKKPSWKATETIFRPFPCVSFDKPEKEFEPYRVVDGDSANFGDWIRRYQCAWGVGTSGASFLIKKQHKMYDVWNSPLGILWRAIENACKKGHRNMAEWQPLREGGMNKGKALKVPSTCYLVQGALLKHDQTTYAGKNGPPLGWGKNPTFILAMSGDTGDRLVDMLNLQKKNYNGPPADFENRYVHGDPVSPLFGRYFHFWEHGKDPRSRYGSEPNTQLASAFESTGDDDGQAGEASQGRGKKPERIGFDVDITSAIDTHPASFTAQGEDQIRSHWQHWDDMLYFPTEIEQAHMLFGCFPVSACLYAFEEHKDWIPEDAYRRAKNAVAAVPAPGGNKEDPGFGDQSEGWGAPTTAAKVKEEPDPFGGQDANDSYSGDAVPDTVVPQGSIDDDPASSAEPEPAPQVPVPPAAAPATPPVPGQPYKSQTADAIAKLAALKNRNSK